MNFWRTLMLMLIDAEIEAKLELLNDLEDNLTLCKTIAQRPDCTGAQLQIVMNNFNIIIAHKAALERRLIYLNVQKLRWL